MPTCVIVGDAAVGKTCFLIRYKEGSLPKSEEYVLFPFHICVSLMFRLFLLFSQLIDARACCSSYIPTVYENYVMPIKVISLREIGRVHVYRDW